MINKEKIYDDEISPLMKEIIKICKDKDIDMVASFSIPIPDDDGLMCTTTLLSENALDVLKKANHIIRNGDHQVMAITITSAKGD